MVLCQGVPCIVIVMCQGVPCIGLIQLHAVTSQKSAYLKVMMPVTCQRRVFQERLQIVSVCNKGILRCLLNTSLHSCTAKRGMAVCLCAFVQFVGCMLFMTIQHRAFCYLQTDLTTFHAFDLALTARRLGSTFSPELCEVCNNSSPGAAMPIEELRVCSVVGARWQWLYAVTGGTFEHDECWPRHYICRPLHRRSNSHGSREEWPPMALLERVGICHFAKLSCVVAEDELCANNMPVSLI